MGDAPFVFAYAAGAPIKAVLAYDSGARGTSTALVVPAGSPIRTVADLKGKKVATVKGSIGHFLLLRLLEDAHVPAKDVQVVFLDPGSTRGALQSGSVDAWATWSPYIGLVTLHDHGRVVKDASGVLEGVGFFAASDKAIAGKSAILSDFLVRLSRAQAWARAHPAQYGAAISKETGLPLDVATALASQFAGHAEPMGPDLVRREYATLETFRKAGVIESTPDIDHAFAPQFTQAALAAAAQPGS
ncbi:MAG: aliphatic sulfonate ABC transporter substrate-binding protein [Caulobacteraceae bacterium]